MKEGLDVSKTDANDVLNGKGKISLNNTKLGNQSNESRKKNGCC